MKIEEVFKEAIGKLRQKNISSAILDAEVLLSHVLKKSSGFIYAHPEENLTIKQAKRFSSLIKKRGNREPVAYLTKSKEFYGLDFYVDKNVLIPRPETEILLEEVLAEIKFKKQKTIADVGTGSGCLAITLAKYLPKIKIWALDRSEKALKVARKNASKLKIKNIKFQKSDLLKKLNQKVEIILANLPYLSSELYQKVQPEIKKEPPEALLAGRDDIIFYRQLFAQALNKLEKGGKIFIEIDPRQLKRIEVTAMFYFPEGEIEIKKDLAGFDRVVIIKT